MDGLFEMAFDHLPVAIGFRDVESGKIIYVNNAMVTLMEHSRETIVGVKPPNFYQNPSLQFEIAQELKEKGFIENNPAGKVSLWAWSKPRWILWP